MPLTRHLYREDEVAAAAAFCLVRGRTQEAVFWCLELLDSGLVDRLFWALRAAWLFAYGIGFPGWILALEGAAAAEEIDGRAMLDLAIALARAGAATRDGSALALLGTAAGDVDTVRPGEACIPVARAEEGYAVLALQQGRARTAWAARPSWALIHGVATWRGSEVAAWVRALEEMADSDAIPEEARRAVAIAAVCLPRGELDRRLKRDWKGAPLPELEAALAEWSGLVGRRARRVYTIPWDCLYWITARGKAPVSVYDSNEKEIMGRLEKPAGIWNSEFWDEAAEEFGGWEAVRNDDEAREAFYEEYFPDDRPDEWSRKERAKSHGGGVLQRGQEATVGRWLQRWFGGLSSAVVWRGVETGIGELERRLGSGGLEEFWVVNLPPPSRIRPLRRKLIPPS
jgi:hypothetical protein